MSKYLKCTTNKPPVSYKCGEKIIFKIEAKNNCYNERYNLIKWYLHGDDGSGSSGIYKFNNHEPLIIETKLDKPGYLHLLANVYIDNATEDKSFDVLDAGAGAEIEKLEYCDTIPEDFDEYWADIEKAVADHEPKILFEKEVTEGVPEGFKSFDIKVSVPCEGRPASGVLTYPVGKKELPILAIFQGYSVAPVFLPTYDPNAICFQVNAHGIDNLESVETAEKKYPELVGYGFKAEENASNMTTYWRNMMIRDLVAVKYVKSHPLWNGKGLKAMGGSQGALQATTVAAHDKDVTYLDISIPWFCNLNAESKGFMKGWRPAFAEGLRYFDTVAQATRVKCPVNIHARLGDYVCPPSTTTTLYNYFRGIKGLDLLQSGTHPYLPPEGYFQRFRYDPSNPGGEIKLGKYRHYKDGEYEVTGFCTDSETGEKCVNYRSLSDGEVYVCPEWMFSEYISVDCVAVKRFKFID